MSKELEQGKITKREFKKIDEKTFNVIEHVSSNIDIEGQLGGLKDFQDKIAQSKYFLEIKKIDTNAVIDTFYKVQDAVDPEEYTEFDKFEVDQDYLDDYAIGKIDIVKHKVQAVNKINDVDATRYSIEQSKMRFNEALGVTAEAKISTGLEFELPLAYEVDEDFMKEYESRFESKEESQD